jgi:AcrR family transcriptional regulator
VSTSYEFAGRTQQKQRTRQALVDAARDLVAQGLTPTVEEAAACAAVSRATAYRYFPNQRALLAAAHPETGASSLLPPNPPDDPEQRVALVVEAFTKLIAATEPQQRTMLQLSLVADDDERKSLPLRQGRAIGWLTEALEPARAQLGDDGLRRAALAIRSATGIEALIWLTDIAGLSQRQAIKLMRWTAIAICRTALADAGNDKDEIGPSPVPH